MAKRKLDDVEKLIAESSGSRRCYEEKNVKKHSLDSDEEDESKDEGRLDADDIEGEEEGIAHQDEDIRISAFNMREELEEGHFDRDGHFIWNNEKEIKDNWLDNIDWQKIKTSSTKYNLTDAAERTLGADSDSEPENEEFDEIETYKLLLSYMQPKESVNKTIQRLGGDNKNLSSVERLKRKKAGTLTSSEEVTKMTELANKILTKTGNMDVYQETYEGIMKKIEQNTNKGKKPAAVEPELDMYAADFTEKEQKKIEESTSLDTKEKENESGPKEVMWEFKWAAKNDKIEGPFTTLQMLKWTNEGYFKSGVLVRKQGEATNFYKSERIDFDLYL